jgi:lysophospholipase L1-like esterase
MGTSITAGIHAPGAYLTPATVASRLNLTPVNVGFDGTCAGTYDRDAFDRFSLCELTNAITSGDWSAQNKSISLMAIGNEASLLKLEKVDFNTVNYLGLEYGTNDFTVCAPLDAFKKSLDHSVHRLLTAFPRTRLFLITPAWILNFEEQDSDTHPNKSGFFLKQYIDAMIEIARSRGVPYLDMRGTLGINAANFKNFTFDGTHPNETGARIRGEVIASFIRNAFR